ncbi:hypothetical protein JRY29_16575 [Salmonella enterica subsp. enterica serovar Kentucky]|nr:hypothetical protein JRY29_16575 [Salmonella enterica subsp. enterica serovar Kentucky]
MRIVSSHDYHISNYDAAKQGSPVVRSLALFIFVDHRTPSLNVGLARDIRKERGSGARLAYESRCAMRLMLV